MEKELQRKIDQALRLLDSAQEQAGEKQIEICFSGGKDSEVILELSKMASINARPIYKNTTIDQPYTIEHCKKKQVEIVRPKKNFNELIITNGYPTRMRRYCCKILKEYKILDFAVQGIRKEESTSRNNRYHEPQVCRIYGKKTNKVNLFLPILYWTEKDIATFIEEKQIECHPLYYDTNHNFIAGKRLGCMGCPLKSDNGLQDFKRYPKLAKMWLKYGKIWWEKNKLTSTKLKFKDHYEVFVRNIFFDDYQTFREATNNMFNQLECKDFLQNYFKIEL